MDKKTSQESNSVEEREERDGHELFIGLVWLGPQDRIYREFIVVLKRLFSPLVIKLRSLNLVVSWMVIQTMKIYLSILKVKMPEKFTLKWSLGIACEKVKKLVFSLILLSKELGRSSFPDKKRYV